MGGNDLSLMCNSKLLERVGGVAHRLPIRATAHDDPDQGLRHRPALKQV
jgi:hypothetical protein